VRDLGFEPEPSIDGKRLHRFVRTTDNQALQRLVVITATKGGRTSDGDHTVFQRP